MSAEKPTWRITGQLIDALGRPVKYGTITLAPVNLPTAYGQATITEPVTISVDKNGYIPDDQDDIPSIPGAVWSLQTLANGRARINDPGDGGVFTLNSLLPWGAPPVTATEAQALRTWLTQEQMDRVDADKALSDRIDAVDGTPNPGTGTGTVVEPNFTATASTLSAGSLPTVTKSGTYPDIALAFGIPSGQDGDPGQPGHSPVISFQGTQIFVDGVAGPDLKGEPGASGTGGGGTAQQVTVIGDQIAIDGTPTGPHLTGLQGLTGPRGPGITVGHGAPTTDDVAGAVYLDLDTGDLYQSDAVDTGETYDLQAIWDYLSGVQDHTDISGAFEVSGRYGTHTIALTGDATMTIVDAADARNLAFDVQCGTHTLTVTTGDTTDLTFTDHARFGLQRSRGVWWGGEATTGGTGAGGGSTGGGGTTVDPSDVVAALDFTSIADGTPVAGMTWSNGTVVGIDQSNPNWSWVVQGGAAHINTVDGWNINGLGLELTLAKMRGRFTYDATGLGGGGTLSFGIGDNGGNNNVPKGGLTWSLNGDYTMAVDLGNTNYAWTPTIAIPDNYAPPRSGEAVFTYDCTTGVATCSLNGTLIASYTASNGNNNYELGQVKAQGIHVGVRGDGAGSVKISKISAELLR